MRVVFLTHNYPRHAGDVAGAFLHPLAIAIRERGIDLRVIAPSDRGRGGHDVLDGVPVHRVRYGSPASETLAYGGTMLSALQSPVGWFGLAALFRSMRRAAAAELRGAADGIVHAHWWIPGGLAAPATHPLVLTCHGTDVAMIRRSALARRLARPPLQRARVVTTVSQVLADVLRTHGQVEVRDSDVVPMPTVAVPRPLSAGGSGLVVIGRLSHQKRVHLAIEAYALMRNEGFTHPMTIVGDGPARTELEALSRRLGLDGSVIFRGGVAPADVPGILATSDLCLMPALGEGFGLAAAEALMQGVPVVACHDGGGLLDIVPPDGAGRLADPRPGPIAQMAFDLLRDRDARSAAALLGAKWARRLAPAAVADHCMEWYQRARQ